MLQEEVADLVKEAAERAELEERFHPDRLLEERAAKLRDNNEDDEQVDVDDRCVTLRVFFSSLENGTDANQRRKNKFYIRTPPPFEKKTETREKIVCLS